MALRPRSTAWFEVVVPETDVGDAMSGLAGLGSVQFEWTGTTGVAPGLADLSGLVARYRALAGRYGRYWPKPESRGRCCTLPVSQSAGAALRQIEAWVQAVREPLERITSLHDERRLLQRWRDLLPALARRAPELDFGALAAAGPALSACCLVLPQDEREATNQAAARFAAQGAGLTLAFRSGTHRAWLWLGRAGDRASLCAWVVARGGECLPLPGLQGSAAAVAAALSPRLAAIARELQSLEAQVFDRARQRGVHHAAGVMERIDWFRQAAQNIRCDGRWCWITGWTSEPDVARLESALQAAGVRGQAALPEPPADIERPSVLRHGVWQRPFELFARAVGAPGPAEADPTVWVALLVPLMFGYMCGDLGHGAVIAAAGLLLRKRTTLWPLVVVCGITAMGFGLAYGDVFGYEHLIEPLWVRPLDQPMLILAVPVGFGALVLTLGLVLHTVESCWRGKGRSEGVADAAQLLVYWGLLLALLWPVTLWGAAIGLLLCLGNRLWMQRDPIAVAAGFGHLVESTFSLLLNTVSFARVGAFALAHAALELVVITIAQGMPGAVSAMLTLIIGNLVVIVLEGLLVSIQASRLVLFEFFLRFFEGTGRPFDPAPAPPAKATAPAAPRLSGRTSRREARPSRGSEG
jgi:V/A-type H+-transporting ATPase subunit I